MPRKKVKTEEELQKEQLKNSMNKIIERLPFCPEPTYIFKMNESVDIGNLKDVIISNIYENGKYYEVTYTSRDSEMGIQNKKGYWFWYNIRRKICTPTNFINNKDLRLSFLNQTIEGLFCKVYFFGVDFEPDYQRDFVWELDDKICLIDSIFQNRELGKFVFNHLDYGKSIYSYEIVDGKQRLRALCDFYEDRFQYKGKFYSELSKKDQNHFCDYSVAVAEIRNCTRKQILEYFIYLNETGHVMSKEQINKVKKMYEEEMKGEIA